ncbi:MAG: triose-phosphate isomerase family protein [Gammaproteobacteria bacterium]
MQKLFIANWKMHGGTAFLAEWASRFSPPGGRRIVVCPPFPYLAAARRILPSEVAVGAQAVFRGARDGAHTGEVSARMLADVGCEYAIVGHSERRAAGETDSDCAAQLAAAAAAGIIPVLCAGESGEDAEKPERAEAAVLRQLRALESLSAGSPFAVAYEPSWAIGSGKTPPAEAISRAGGAIRRQIIVQKGAFGGTMPVLYGGSIKAENAALLGRAGMDGGLVGGASLDAAEFAQICRAGGAE